MGLTSLKTWSYLMPMEDSILKDTFAGNTLKEWGFENKPVDSFISSHAPDDQITENFQVSV